MRCNKCWAATDTGPAMNIDTLSLAFGSLYDGMDFFEVLGNECLVCIVYIEVKPLTGRTYVL